MKITQFTKTCENVFYLACVVFAGGFFFASAAAKAEEYILTAPPRETPAEGQVLYEPLAKFLTQVTRQPWRYKHPENWLNYVKMVVGDEAHADFTDPHFAGYQVLYHNDHLVARAQSDDEWLLVAKKGDRSFQVGGKPACLFPPPHIANLIYTNQKIFDNPARLPYVVISSSSQASVDSVLAGRCKFTLLTRTDIEKLDETRRSGIETKMLTKLPGQALTVKSDFDAATVQKIRAALLSAAGQAATKNLRDRFAQGAPLVATEDVQGYLYASAMLVDDYLIPMGQTDSAFALAEQSAGEARGSTQGRAGAEEWIRRVDPLLVPDIRAVQALANNPILREAVKAQNAKGATLERIKQLDDAWKKTKELTPFKRSLQEGNAGTLLKQTVTLNPSYGELFLTDNQGANVAAFPATSDYWQGDEEKFTESFKDGGRIFVGPVEYDDSSKSVSIQISAPVFDENNRVIGVLVAGIILDYVEWKQKQK
jgi:hypothetical protein